MAGTNGVWNGPVAITTWSASYARSRGLDHEAAVVAGGTAVTSLLSSTGRSSAPRSPEVGDDLVALG